MRNRTSLLGAAFLIAAGLILAAFIAPIFGEKIAQNNPSLATQVAVPASAQEASTSVPPLYYIRIKSHVDGDNWYIDEIDTNCPWVLQETFEGRRSGTFSQDSSTGAYISFVAVCINPETKVPCARGTANLQKAIGPTPVPLPTLTAVPPCTIACETPTVVRPTLTVPTVTPPAGYIPCSEKGEKEYTTDWSAWTYDEASGQEVSFRHWVIKDKNTGEICDEGDEPRFQPQVPSPTVALPILNPTMPVPAPVCLDPRGINTETGRPCTEIPQSYPDLSVSAVGICTVLQDGSTAARFDVTVNEGQVVEASYNADQPFFSVPAHEPTDQHLPNPLQVSFPVSGTVQLHGVATGYRAYNVLPFSSNIVLDDCRPKPETANVENAQVQVEPSAVPETTRRKPITSGDQSMNESFSTNLLILEIVVGFLLFSSSIVLVIRRKQVAQVIKAWKR